MAAPSVHLYGFSLITGRDFDLAASPSDLFWTVLVVALLSTSTKAVSNGVTELPLMSEGMSASPLELLALPESLSVSILCPCAASKHLLHCIGS